MTILREIAAGLFVTLAAGGIILSVIPERVNKRAVSVLAALSVLCALTVPLSGKRIEFFSFRREAYSSDSSLYEREIILHLTNEAEKAAYSAAEEVLLSLGINDYEIYPCVVSDGTIINLEEVSIYLGSAYAGREAEVKKAISDALGAPAEVEIQDE